PDEDPIRRYRARGPHADGARRGAYDRAGEEDLLPRLVRAVSGARLRGRAVIVADLVSLAADAERRYVERNPESKRLHEERALVMPGGNTRSVIHVPPFPLTIVRGEGARLVDADGHEYVDLLGEYTAGLYGHSHPVILQAIRAAL